MALTRLPLNAATGTLAQLNTAVTDADVQPVLVSGANIKTLNNTTVLGSGNIDLFTLSQAQATSISFLSL